MKTIARSRLSVARRAVATLVGALVIVAGLSAPAAAQTPTGAAPLPGLLAPYYTELDLTHDLQVTQEDVDLAFWLLGETSTSPRWKKVASADTDGDGVLTIRDVADLARRMVYDDGPFELVEASALDMQAAMNAGVTTSVEITQEYLDRIAAYDRTLIGSRPLYSIISANPQALAIAAAMDAERAAQGPRSMLAGVPVIVKDNYDTTDMPTTGGCGCWDANLTATDATMVKGLRADGAIILAKASLDEYAFGFVSEFSSFQPPGTHAAGGQPVRHSRARRAARAAAPARPSRRISVASASARTPADRSASRRRTTSSWACARRSGWRAGTASSRSRSARTPAGR